MLYGIETWSVKEEYVMPEDKISAEELRARLALKSLKECLQDRRLQWFEFRNNGRECMV